MIKGTKKEFENLADYILHDYFGEDYDTPKPMDIFSFAENYLKMDVGYIEFAKSNHIIGVRSAGRIYVDKDLQAPEKRGTRNFTVAHECAHEIINWQDENYNPGQLINCREMRERKRLVTEEDFNEWQANVVGAYLLMRPTLVGWCMFTFSKKDTLTVFGDRENPAMYSRRAGTDIITKNRLYVIEHRYDTRESALSDFKERTELCLDGICEDVFGDG